MAEYLDLKNDPRIASLAEGDVVLIRLTAIQPPAAPQPWRPVVIPGGRDAKPPPARGQAEQPQ
jgi:hypothetical protein